LYETCLVSFQDLSSSYNCLLSILYPLKCLWSVQRFSALGYQYQFTRRLNYLDLTTRRLYHRRIISFCSALLQAVFVSGKPLDFFFFFSFLAHKITSYNIWGHLFKEKWLNTKTLTEEQYEYFHGKYKLPFSIHSPSKYLLFCQLPYCNKFWGNCIFSCTCLHSAETLLPFVWDCALMIPQISCFCYIRVTFFKPWTTSSTYQLGLFLLSRVQFTIYQLYAYITWLSSPCPSPAAAAAADVCHSVSDQKTQKKMSFLASIRKKKSIF